MADNILGGRINLYIAKTTKTFESMGFNGTNCLVIYQIDSVIKSWKPSRAINAISGQVTGKTYYCVMAPAAADMDKEIDCAPPLVENGFIMLETDGALLNELVPSESKRISALSSADLGEMSWLAGVEVTGSEPYENKRYHPTFFKVASGDLDNQTGSVDVCSFVVGGDDANFLVTGYLNNNIGGTGGTFKMIVSYTSPDGGAQRSGLYGVHEQTASGILVAVGNNVTFTPLMLRAQAGSTITISAQLHSGTGPYLFNAGAILHRI